MKRLLLTLRLFRNYKLYSFVNVVGLALSLACVIAISRYLYSELSVDSMHAKHSNIYGVVEISENSNSAYPAKSENINKIENFVDMSADPSVMANASIITHNDLTITCNQKDYTVDALSVDSVFTKVFDFTTSIGSLQDVERSVDKAAISIELAQRLFGNDDPLGKTLQIKEKIYTVSAILEKPTSKTSIQFDMIIPTVHWHYWMRREAQYFVMPDDFDYKAFNDKYNKYYSFYTGSEPVKFAVRPLEDFYFDRSIKMRDKDMRPIGDRAQIKIIFLVGLGVLVIGLFNFVNIYTVLMLRRAREVGVKKVFGASTSSITGSIYMENLLMVIVAVLVGWLLTLLCSEFISSTLGIPMVNNIRFDTIFTALVVLFLPLITTVYPYFKYRYAKPITSLRSINSGGGSIVSRALFLVLQYSMTIVMIIISIYFVRQLDYMLNADLGYKSDGIIAAKLFFNKQKEVYKEGEWEARKQEREKMLNNSLIICDELSRSPLVENFSYNDSPNLISSNSYTKIKLLPDGQEKDLITFGCGTKFFEMFDIKKLKGRLWSDSTDKFTQYFCIVNEAMLRELGIEDYTKASIQTNRRLWYSVTNKEESELMKQNPPYTIVGVVKDFQIGHLSGNVPPLLIYFSESDAAESNPIWARMHVRAAAGKTNEAIELLSNLHAKYGNGEFSYTMISDEIAQQYENDRRVTNIYTTFALIAIIIGSLGLFSLSLYDVQQRYREIALRRVNGATVMEIITMLLGKYYILLGISFVIAASVSYFVIDWYMQDFAHKAPLSWWIFVVSAALTGAISMLTLIFQITKAASTNPAVAMKSE